VDKITGIIISIIGKVVSITYITYSVSVINEQPKSKQKRKKEKKKKRKKGKNKKREKEKKSVC
jgi:uncharacterized ion transporter superfamily protein YfcC